MTKVNSWKCDICGMEFRPGDGGYNANDALEITIPSATVFEREEKFSYKDTCYNCRIELSILINAFVDKKRGIKNDY